MARITGLGGIFIKSPDPKALSAWYRDVLGLDVQDWGGAVIRATAESPASAVWSVFGADTKHFEPSKREVMVNFAVDDLDAYLAQLEAKGVAVLERMDGDMHGKFAWVLDPDGTKIELWQPVATK